MYLKRRKRNPRRNPLKLLRQPCSLKDSGGQNFSHQFLLANSFERCRRTSQTVQRVPNVRKASSRAYSRANLHSSYLAVRMLGARPSRATQKGQRWIWLHLRRNRQFTKWIEYKPLVKYSTAKAVEFIQDIMHRFRIPNRVITDLGSPFTAIEFKNWAQDYDISIDYASVAQDCDIRIRRL
jgi:transposase InsO family protein